MKYRPEIDGLRAFSVVAVILYHAKAGFATGGFVGVDVFFVLSGYLISSILISDLQQDRFSIRRFYVRRIRRIMPALLLVSGLTLLLAPFLLPLSETIEVFQSGAATALFLANFRFMRMTGYFQPGADDQPLLHMWSLAVEEQFYIIFPLFLLLLWRWRPAGITPVFLGVALVSLALAELGWRQDPNVNFFLPVTRAWELLAGAIVARHYSVKEDEPDPISKTAGALALAGLAMVLLPVVWFNQDTPSPSVWILIPVVGTVLVILCARAGTLAQRVLGWRYLVGIGLISYSAYLLHQPILVYARVLIPPEDRTTPVMVALGLASLPLGYLSWRFVERPARYKMATRPLVVVSVTVSLAIAALGIVSKTDQPAIERIYRATLGGGEAAERFAVIQEASDKHAVVFETECRWISYSLDAAFEERFRGCAAKYGKAVLVLGDSHAEDLIGMLASASGHPFMAALSRARCRPHRSLNGAPLYDCQYEAVAKFIELETARIALVAYTQPFFTLFDKYRDTTSTEGFHPELLVEVADYLERIAQYSPVVMFGPRRTLGFTVLRLSPRRPFAPQILKMYPKGLRGAEDLVDQSFRRELEVRGVGYVSMIDLLNQDLPNDALVDGKLVFQDGDHLTAFGEEILGARLLTSLRSARGAGATLAYSILGPGMSD